MSSTDRGTVVEVSIRKLGDELTADAAVGATTLTVGDAADFHEDGGQLTLGLDTGEANALAYTTVDDDAGTVTLAAPLTKAYVTGDRVDLYPPADEKTAQVMVGDTDESVLVTVPHVMFERLPDGIRDEGAGEIVELELFGTEYVVTDVLGTPAELVGAVLTGALIRTSEDGARVQIVGGGDDIEVYTGDASETHPGRIVGSPPSSLWFQSPRTEGIASDIYRSHLILRGATPTMPAWAELSAFDGHIYLSALGTFFNTYGRGRALYGIDFGEATRTTDVGGILSIPHNLAVKPKAAIVTPSFQNMANSRCRVWSTNTADLLVEIREAHTTALRPNLTVDLFWLAIA